MSKQPPTPRISPKSPIQFALEACKSRSSGYFQISQTANLVDTLTSTLQKEYPDLGSGEAFSHAKTGLSLKCTTCGSLFNQQAIAMLYLASKGTMKGAVFGGPNVAALGRGACPGCGGRAVEVTFDPTKIQTRQEALKLSKREAAGIPELMSTCPGVTFQTSLDVSPDESLICFVAPEGGRGIVRAYEVGTLNQRWGFSVPASESCRCMYVGPERVLTLSKKEKNSIIQLVNSTDGSEVAKVAGPNVYFQYGTADLKTGFFVTESSYDTLLMIQTSGDTLNLSTYECGQIYSPGPMIGPDGKCYVIVHYRLYRIENKSKKEIMPGDNCICFDPAGKVYCGGGFADRSGESALHIADTKSGNISEIPYGRQPIDQIALAGDGQLLLANIVNEIHVGRYPNAMVTLFSISERKKIWNLEIKDLKPWHPPVLLSEPEEGWALIQTGKFLKQISLQDGKTMRILPKNRNEFVDARWLKSKKLLYITRNPELQFRKRAPGLLECYKL